MAGIRVFSLPTKEDKTEDGTVADPFYGWRTTLFNCDCHSFMEVELQLVRAIRCTPQQARKYSTQIHNMGKVVVYSGYKEKAEAIAMVLSEIRLQVTVSQ